MEVGFFILMQIHITEGVSMKVLGNFTFCVVFGFMVAFEINIV